MFPPFYTDIVFPLEKYGWQSVQPWMKVLRGSQAVRRRIVNPETAGSNPALAATVRKMHTFF